MLHLQRVRHHLLLWLCNDNAKKSDIGGIWSSATSVNIRFQVALLCLVAGCVIGLSNNRPSACLIIHISQYENIQSTNYAISIMRECSSAADTLQGRYSPRKLLKYVSEWNPLVTVSVRFELFPPRRVNESELSSKQEAPPQHVSALT